MFATPKIVLILNGLMEAFAGLQALAMPAGALKNLFLGLATGAGADTIVRAFGVAALSLAVLAFLGCTTTDTAALKLVLGTLIFYNVVIAGLFIWFIKSGVKNIIALVIHFLFSAALIYY